MRLGIVKSTFILFIVIFTSYVNLYCLKIIFPRPGQGLTAETCFKFQFEDQKILKLFKSTQKVSIQRYDRRTRKSVKFWFKKNEYSNDYQFISNDIVETLKPINLKNFPFCDLFILFNNDIDEYLSDDKSKMFGPLTKKLSWLRKEMKNSQFNKLKYSINNGNMIKQIGDKFYMHYNIRVFLLFFDGDKSRKKKKKEIVDYNRIKIVNGSNSEEWKERLQTISPNNVSRIFSSTPFFEWKWENPAGKYLVFEVGDHEKSTHGFITVYKKKFKRRNERLSLFKFKLPAGIIKLGKQYKWRITTVRADDSAIHTAGPRVFETVKW